MIYFWTPVLDIYPTYPLDLRYPILSIYSSDNLLLIFISRTNLIKEITLAVNNDDVSLIWMWQTGLNQRNLEKFLLSCSPNQLALRSILKQLTNDRGKY